MVYGLNVTMLKVVKIYGGPKIGGAGHDLIRLIQHGKLSFRKPLDLSGIMCGGDNLILGQGREAGPLHRLQLLDHLKPTVDHPKGFAHGLLLLGIRDLEIS
jgi:hypothetical protein